MFIADYHVHSSFSKDGKSLIEENVQSAIQKGLKEIAVTEHAYSSFNGIKKNALPKILDEVERLRIKYPEINILKGIEMNLLDEKGSVDVSKAEQEKLDFVVLGFHKNCRFLKNLFSHLKMMRANKKQIEKNTNAYIKAMENNKVNVLAHLYYANAYVDIKKISDFAGKHNILIELNGKRIYFTEKDVKIMLDAGVKFIANSDSHEKDSVGDNSKAYNFAIKHGIPLDRIVNWNSVLDLKASKKEGK